MAETPALGGPSFGKHHQKKETEDHCCQGNSQTPAQKQPIATQHIGGLPNDGKVGKHEGVVPEQELEIVGGGKAQHHRGGEGVAHQDPAGEAVEQQGQTHAGGNVQRQQNRGGKESLYIADRIGADGQKQRGEPNANSGEGNPEELPRPEAQARLGRPVLRGLAKAEKRFH